MGLVIICHVVVANNIPDTNTIPTPSFNNILILVDMNKIINKSKFNCFFLSFVIIFCLSPSLLFLFPQGNENSG